MNSHLSSTPISIASGSSSRVADSNSIGQFNEAGVVLSPGSSFEDYCRKRGFCPTCGIVQTHKRRATFKKGIKREPLTKEGEVFEGHCLKCHSMDEIMSNSEVAIRVQDQRKKALEKQRGRRSSFVSMKVKKKPVNFDFSDGDSTEGSNSQVLEKATPSCSLRNIQVVLTEMLTQPDDATAQAKGCACLAKLSNERHNDDFMIGAMDAIVDAMNTHIENGLVQEEGCRALRRYSTGSSNPNGLLCAGEEIDSTSEACYNISAQGGIFAVLSAMASHRDSLPIQREGARVLRNVLHSLGAAQKMIIDNGGLEIIIRCMADHGKSATVQEDGCVILWSLAYDDADAQEIIANNDGVDAVLNAMRVYSQLQKVQYHGCGVLHTLSASQENTRRILDYGGFDVVINAVRKYGNVAGVAEKACGALANMAVNAEERCKDRLEAMDQEELRALSNTMQLHPKSCSVQASACYLLHVASQS